MYLLGVIGFGVLFWAIWVALNVADGLRSSSLGWRIAFYALILPGGIIDIAFNWTVASVLFFEFPGVATLSQRLTGYVANPVRPPVWRTRLAVFIATTLIEPWAPGHIGLVKFGWPPARNTATWLKRMFPKDTGAHL